jgi:hypothetical protein
MNCVFADERIVFDPENTSVKFVYHEKGHLIKLGAWEGERCTQNCKRKHRCWRQDMNLTSSRYEGVEWNHLARNRDQWLPFGNKANRTWIA